MQKESSALFKEFAELSKAEWLDKINKDLKGKPYTDLQWHIKEGLVLEPFYMAEDIAELNHSVLQTVSGNDWLIGETFVTEDIKKTNTQLLNALMNGVNAPKIIFKKYIDKTALQQLFKDIQFEYIHTTFALETSLADTLLPLLASVVDKPNAAAFSFDFLTETRENTAQHFQQIQKTLKQYFPSFKLNISATSFHRGHSFVTEELAETIAKGCDFLDHLSKEEAQQNCLQFSVAIGKSYFVEIAKIRALKLLWIEVQKSYGLRVPILPFIDVYFDKNAYDEAIHTNKIRATTMAMAAAIGGANRLTVRPSDGEFEFSHRIARNIQHLLKMESYFDKVSDPAAGSYYIETLTHKLAKSAWEKFQQMVTS